MRPAVVRRAIAYGGVDKTLWIDHVIYGVQDLELARVRFLAEYGLSTIDGGIHPGGTRNAVVVCQDGTSYIELLAVHDPAGPTARWLSGMTADGDRWCGWALRTDDIDGVAARLGVSARPGSIERADGTTESWTVAGIERRKEAHLPFFIEYGPSRRLREWTPGSPLTIDWVEVGGDPGRLIDWLGGDVPGVRLVGGKPEVRAVGLAMSSGKIEIVSSP
jgi:hypothetical protein